MRWVRGRHIPAVGFARDLKFLAAAEEEEEEEEKEKEEGMSTL